jgi:aspartate carbamoyltransferase catalytic subunit
MTKVTDSSGQPLRHLLGIEGLMADQITALVDLGEEFIEINERPVKKVPALRGKTVINLFLEPSTRTRTSFEIAAKRLSAESINIGAKDSSVTKGESLLDTGLTLQAMAPDIVVMRHSSSGAPHFLANMLGKTAIVNAGDGLHEHPTQALLDAIAIRRRLGRLTGLTLTFVGDAYRSRVARSNIFLHRALGNSVRLVAPPTMAVKEFEDMGVEVSYTLEKGIKDADIVMPLRMKHEYLKDFFIPSLDEYSRLYCINEERLSRYCPEAIVLSPGPIDRGCEIDSHVADGLRSEIQRQVTFGVALRMSVLFLLAHGSQDAVQGLGGEQ